MPYTSSQMAFQLMSLMKMFLFNGWVPWGPMCHRHLGTVMPLTWLHTVSWCYHWHPLIEWILPQVKYCLTSMRRWYFPPWWCLYTPPRNCHPLRRLSTCSWSCHRILKVYQQWPSVNCLSRAQGSSTPAQQMTQPWYCLSVWVWMVQYCISTHQSMAVMNLPCSSSTGGHIHRVP